MFAQENNYPTAVASYDEAGVAAAIEWCAGRMEEGDVLTVWTSLKSNLQNCDELHDLVTRHSDVEHVTGRSHATPRGRGPVLMAWPDMDDIGGLTRHSQRIRALCIVAWNEDDIRSWVMAMNPTVLGDGSAWDEPTADLDPILVEALKGLTLTINHNNTISAGYEKDQVASVLLVLHDAGIHMEAEAMQGWALANGWSGKNPGRLAGFVRDINAGKRPRARRVLRADYIDILRERSRAATPGIDDEPWADPDAIT